jgi:hypothetical protein
MVFARTPDPTGSLSRPWRGRAPPLPPPAAGPALPYAALQIHRLTGYTLISYISSRPGHTGAHKNARRKQRHAPKIPIEPRERHCNTENRG